MATSKLDRQLTLEIGKEGKDWEDFFLMCGESFQDSPLANRYLSELEDRREFLRLYFKYVYENKVADQSASLVCIKDKHSGNVEMLYGSTYIFRFDSPPGDATKLQRKYGKELTVFLRKDTWFFNNIHEPMRRIAESIGTVAWYPDRQVVANSHKRKGIRKNYEIAAHNLLYKESLKTLKFKTKILPIIYWIVLPGFRGLLQNSLDRGGTVIAHLHYNFKSNLKCYKDPSVTSEGEINCVLLMMSRNEIGLTVKKLFNSQSSL